MKNYVNWRKDSFYIAPSYIQGTWRINAAATSVRFVFPTRGRWHSIGHRARRNDFNPPGFLGERDRSPCIRSSKILLHAEVCRGDTERKEEGKRRFKGGKREGARRRTHSVGYTPRHEGSEWEKALCNCNPDKYPEPRRTTNEQREVRERERERRRRKG